MNISKFALGLKTLIPKLPTSQKQALVLALENANNETDFRYIKEWLENPDLWLMPKVSLNTFLDSKYYLGIWKTVYPKVRAICKEIIEGGYIEWVEVAWIWAWKSFSSEILACYQTHHLLCLRSPHYFYKLAPDKNIAIINMGINATQAMEVVFTWIRNFIKDSPFFCQFDPKILAWTIKFNDQKIILVSWNSRATTPLWYNVFCAVLDEAAFFIDNEDKNTAQEIYESLQRRIVSRFGKDWLIVMISSPRYNEDFIMTKLEEANLLDDKWRKINPHIFAIQLPTWKVKNPEVYKDSDRFYFHNRKSQILDFWLEELEKNYKVNKVEEKDFSEEYDVWEIPDDFKASFIQNPEKAKRDFAAVPALTLSWFFPSPTIVKEVFNYERVNPVISPWEFKFEHRPERVQYYVHIDIWLNRDWKWDHTWLAMGHFWGLHYDEVTWEFRKKVIIDFMEQIKAPNWIWEIQISDIRKRIYSLSRMWYNIALITLDWFMSKDITQILKSKGYKCEYLSVDRHIDPYNILKELINEKRIDMPYLEIVEKELIRLELIKGIKVDHPPGWSKDVADALAWCCFSVISKTPSWRLGLEMERPFNNLSESEKQVIELKQKEKQIRIQQQVVERADWLFNNTINNE